MLAMVLETPMLEHLAALGWFGRHGEVALTAGLTFCLEKDRGAANALIGLLRARSGLTGTDLPFPARWYAEGIDEERNRVDVVGYSDGDGASAEIVLVEAKVSAEFARDQVSTYVARQQRSLERASVSSGVLAVLVPEDRVRAASVEVQRDLAQLGVAASDQPWRIGGSAVVVVVVISWDAAIDAMLADAKPAADDLRQLLGACRALKGADVLALTAADLAGGWRGRKEDLRLMIRRVTGQATAELSLQLQPWQKNASAGLDGGYRYLGISGQPNLAVGTRADGSDPPLWVRWHERTAKIELVLDRLQAIGHSPQADERGSLWLPLDLRPDTGAATRQIEHLVHQVVEVFNATVEWPAAV